MLLTDALLTVNGLIFSIQGVGGLFVAVQESYDA
jgi:hypothetical protein